MLQDILVPFIAVGLAELGDKTQLAVLALSSKTRKYGELLFGIILAFAVADGLAILLGEFISNMFSFQLINIISGIIFIVFGVMMLLKRDEKDEEHELGNVFVSSFSLILISEMGDKTQISAALFAVQFNPWLVFLGVISAMALLSIMAVFSGKPIVARMDKKMLNLTAAVLFIIIGLWTLFSA